ncbi:MAG: cohesin domain-containing protein, partial [Bacteroidota bacterium]
MKKILLINLFMFLACTLMAQQSTSTSNPGQLDVQTIDALDSVIFDCSQLTGATGAIQIPVSIKSDDLVYSVDFSLKYDHSVLQYDTTINVTTYLQGLSNYFLIDSTIRFTSSTFTPCTNDTTLALVKFNLLAPSFTNGSIFTLKGYLNGTLCSTKYIPPSPVGISENVIKNFTVYPHPAQDAVSINFENADSVEV